MACRFPASISRAIFYGEMYNVNLTNALYRRVAPRRQRKSDFNPAGGIVFAPLTGVRYDGLVTVSPIM